MQVDRVAKAKIMKEIKIPELGQLKKHLGMYYKRNKNKQGPYWEANMHAAFC